VRGNQLVDSATNATVVLKGVSHSGSEFLCVQNRGIFDSGGPPPIAPIAAWSANVVRLPLNEGCWLGINGVNAAYSGGPYRAAVKAYVDTILAAGLAVIVDLHWTAPGTQQATGQMAMPDADHAPAFWTSVATTFSYSQRVLFEIFNEPFPGGTFGTQETDWQCWTSGGSACQGLSNVTFAAAGMKQLVAAVRATGATNVLLLGSLAYSNDLSGWLAAAADIDPFENVAAVWHSYDFNSCASELCWDATVAPVAAKVPVVVTECGFKPSYVCCDLNTLWPYLERKGISYLAWSWNDWKTTKHSALVLDYQGTPSSGWGATYKSWLAKHPGKLFN
jgi:hypothetical protein